MLFTLLMQVALLVGIIVSLAFTAARSLVDYCAQAIGTGLAPLALVALWMLFPSVAAVSEMVRE